MTTTTTLAFVNEVFDTLDDIISNFQTPTRAPSTNDTPANTTDDDSSFELAAAAVEGISNAVRSASESIVNAPPEVAEQLIKQGAIQSLLGSISAVSNILNDQAALASPSSSHPNSKSGGTTIKPAISSQQLTASIEDFTVSLVSKALRSPDSINSTETTVLQSPDNKTTVAWKTAYDLPKVELVFEKECTTTNLTEFGQAVTTTLRTLGLPSSATSAQPQVSCNDASVISEQRRRRAVNFGHSIRVVLTVESTEISASIATLVNDGVLLVNGVGATLIVDAAAGAAEAAAALDNKQIVTISMEVAGAMAVVPMFLDLNSNNGTAPPPPVVIMIVYEQSDSTELLFPSNPPNVEEASADISLLPKLSTAVVSISLGENDGDGPTNLPLNVQINFDVDTGGAYEDAIRTANVDSNSRLISCVWWDYAKVHDSSPDENQTTGDWSSAGCSVAEANTAVDNSTHVTCSCSHLTHFAVLFTPNVKSRPKLHEDLLEGFSLFGTVLGMIGIGASLTTFGMNRDLVELPEMIVINLCIAIGVGTIMFMAATDRAAGQSTASCTAVAGLLHYFLLAAWGWQLCEGRHLYTTFVEVVGGESEHTFKYFMIAGWGAPLIFVIPSIIVFTDDYTYTNDGVQGTCWIDPTSNAVYMYIIPALVGLTTNVLVCVHVMFAVAGATDSQKSRAKAMLTFGTTLGLVYLFGAMLVMRPAHAFTWELLFSFGIGSQGLVIFYFHVYRKEAFQHRIKATLSKTFGDGSSKNKTSHGVNLKASRLKRSTRGGTRAKSAMRGGSTHTNIPSMSVSGGPSTHFCPGQSNVMAPFDAQVGEVAEGIDEPIDVHVIAGIASNWDSTYVDTTPNADVFNALQNLKPTSKRSGAILLDQEDLREDKAGAGSLAGRYQSQVRAVTTHVFGGRKQSLAAASTFSADDVGQVVSVIGYDVRGTLRFWGPHHEDGEIRLGVEMDHPVSNGRSGIFKGVNGSVHRYFECKHGAGLLLMPENVLRVKEYSNEVDLVDVTKKATEIFHMFDTDKNMKLSVAELSHMLRCMHQSHINAKVRLGDDPKWANEQKVFENFNEEEVAELMFLEVDTNGDGHISRKEFLLSCQEAGELHDFVKHAVVSELLQTRHA